MSELNPNKRIVESEGVDIPVMYVYLAGRISGNCIDKCLAWRNKIIDHYADYKGKGVYPISFLDALNSKEADSIDAQGLTSAIPPNLIYNKDMMSVKRADVVVAYMDDFMEEGLSFYSYNHNNQKRIINIHNISKEALLEHVSQLESSIKNRRPNYGTDCEVSWALWLQKPLILIAGDEKRYNILTKHPFMCRASIIVKDVDELLEKKWLNMLYKSISSAIY